MLNNVLAKLDMNVLMYLAPTFALAVVIKILIQKHPIFYFLNLAGTITHEASHWIIGFITFANPQGFSIIPKKEGDAWTLGSVSFKNLGWYNAAPTALAPFLLLAIPFIVAKYKTVQGIHFSVNDIGVAFLVAPQLISFWPSSVDWRLACKSWPYVIIGAGYVWFFHRDWFLQFAH
jgi:hypothetical protein